MEKHGVHIDTARRKFVFKKDFCDHVSAPYVDKAIKKAELAGTLPKVGLLKTVQYKITKSWGPPKQPIKNSTSPPEFNGKKKRIAQINAIAFNTLAKNPNNEIFAVSIKDINNELTKRSKPLTNPKLKLIPRHHHLINVFLKKKANTLPPRRPNVNHKIKIEKDFKLRPTRLLRSSNKKLRVMQKYLNENLKKNFIQYSKSNYAFPVLFVKKPGGGLRFYINYRQFNKITQKNKYPLPLINEILIEINSAQ